MAKVFDVIELFSGIGAQRMALMKEGIPHKVVATSEIDRFALRSYEAIYGDNPNLGDITQLDGLPPSDILTYSFPCTDLSTANPKRTGMARGTNQRSSLVWEVYRLLEESRARGHLPKWLVMENVPSIHSKRFMAEFQDWIDALGVIGYVSRWSDTNPTRFGLPQNRARTILLSHLGSICPPVPRGTDGHIPLRDVLEPDVDLKRYKVSEAVMKKLMYDGNPYGHRDFLRVINDTKLGYADAYEGDGVTLQHLVGKHRARGRVQKDRAHTLMTGGGCVGVVVRDNDGFLTVRRFTPREAYRLQGFPDWAFDCARDAGISDTQLYRQAGNSIAVPVMGAIMRTINDYEVTVVTK